MIAKILISPLLEKRVEEINKILIDNNLSANHPDLLYFPNNSKLGIFEARKIKEHFSLKPYSAKGRAVALENASTLTHEAQNALLKTLEEPPPEAILILGASSDTKFLPTILSRCEIIRLQSTDDRQQTEDFSDDIEKLLKSKVEERFEYVEKLKDREDFLHALVSYFHQDLNLHPGGANLNFMKEILQSEEWAEANVNIRAILEYLMLVMPQKV